MRHVYVIIDMSNAMSLQDMKPSRFLCTVKLMDMFFNEFMDQNPISQIGLIVTRNKRAEIISVLSGNVKNHLDALKRLPDMACSGEPSLQNALQLALRTLKYEYKTIGV